MKNLILFAILLVTLGTALLACGSDTVPAEPDPQPINQTQDNSIFQNSSESLLPQAAVSGRSMDAEVADFDQDGDLDIFLANEFGGNVLLLNDGQGKMSNASMSRLPQKDFDSEDIALADFDKDGDIDVIFVSEDTKVNEFYINDGGFFLDVSGRLPVEGTTNAILAIDLNQDEVMDLILGNAGQNIVLINDGQGNFSNETKARLPQILATTQDLEAGDIDQDGDLDILVGNEDGNYFLINNGQGVFEKADAARLPTNPALEETREAELGDVDGDGDLDIFFANVAFQAGKDSQNRLLLNDGQGNFTDQTALLPQEKFHTVEGDFEDIDEDGDMDLLIGNGFGGGFQVYINNGQGQFSDQTKDFIPNLLVDVIDVEMADFNGDGKRDLYICNFQGADVLLTQ